MLLKACLIYEDTEICWHLRRTEVLYVYAKREDITEARKIYNRVKMTK